MAIEVARRVGRPLEVVGTGPLRRRLEREAKGDVRFLGWLSPDELRDAYRRAAALLVPNVEDFGMVTVEALACGTPVVGLAASGTADVVRAGVEGELAESCSAEALADALERLLARQTEVGTLRSRAQVFSRERFLLRFRFLLDRLGVGDVLQ